MKKLKKFVKNSIKKAITEFLDTSEAALSQKTAQKKAWYKPGFFMHFLFVRQRETLASGEPSFVRIATDS